MAYIKNQCLKDLYPDSRTMLAAAYAYAGDKKVARELLPNTLAGSSVERQMGGNLNSAIRTDAIVLGVLADLDPSSPAVPKLIRRLTSGIDKNKGYWGTTQENAFAFMALGKILKHKGKAAYSGVVLANGKEIATFDSKNTKRISNNQLGQGKITIKVEGTGDCYYYAESSGISTSQVPEVDQGIVVRRDFLDRFGHRLDLKHVKQGDLVMARITVKVNQAMENVAIIDLLPTGLEIENPRLASGAKIEWMSSELFTPNYMDIRDDRLMLFANFDDAGTKSFYYALRAVAKGTFTVPPVQAECMYEPDVYSIASSGQMQVVE
jgi:uncharacterized protein YfaS (alpha-2-macroglobulin family)